MVVGGGDEPLTQLLLSSLMGAAAGQDRRWERTWRATRRLPPPHNGAKWPLSHL